MIDLREKEKKEVEEKEALEKSNMKTVVSVNVETKIENVEPKIEEVKEVKDEKKINNEINQLNPIQNVEINKKQMKNIDLSNTRIRNIIVNSNNKVNPKEVVPNSVIMKEENGAFVIINTSEEHELDITLNEDLKRLSK
jgi:hypothetical protein